MWRFVFTLVCSLLFSSVWADNSLEPLLNKVTLRLSAEQWVTTKTALVTIGVNASVSDADLGKIQSGIMDHLNKISKADWHIVSFNRNQDQSGLEKIQASAQARLEQSELSGLRDKAKSITKPGETYTIDNVEFTPSDAEIRAANVVLRNDIYQQIKMEMDTLSKSYPDQKYYVHDVNFLNEIMPMSMPRAENMMLAAKVSRAEPMMVGDKVRLTATIVLAAAPNADVVKVVHN